ncbi:MAG: hypothetical protein GX809_03870 [Clostridiaceae bacterium]|nr:hypothetical protein [Clostridiaceae bacterium]
MRRFWSIPISLRRRTALTASAILLVIALVVLGIVWQAAGLLSSRKASLVQVSDRTASQLALSGTGMNLTGLPATNLVTNGSFSPIIRHVHYFASDGRPGELHIKMSEARSRVPLTQDYYTGASFSLFRESLSEMKQINQGSITGYEAGIMSGKRGISLPAELEGTRWMDFAQQDGTIYACGTEGALIKLPRDGEPEQMDFRFSVNLTAMAAGKEGLLAGDAQGKLYASPDGVNWNLIMQSQRDYAIGAIEYIDIPDYDNGFFLASGGPGELFFGYPSGMEQLSFPLDGQVTALVRAGDGIIYALEDQGRVASSSNGIQWQIEESLSSDQAWLAGKAGAGLTLFAGRGGRIAIKPDKGAARFLEPQGMDVGSDPTEIMIMSSGKFILLTSKGGLFSSKDGGRSWTGENPFEESRIEGFELFPTGDILLARRDGELILGELTAQIRFDPPLEGGSVVAGDLMTISLTELPGLDTSQVSGTLREEPLPAGEWAISGGASFLTSQDIHAGREGYDSGGSCALSYDLPDPELDSEPIVKALFSIHQGTATAIPVNNPDRSYLSARLTQKLDLSRLLASDALPFYRLEFDLRTEGDIDGPVEVWFSGSMPAVGELVKHTGDAWQHRRLSLLFPRALKADDEIWINFGFAGSGTLYLDNIWFGRNDDAPGALSSLLAEQKEAWPDVIRLDAVPIGRSGYGEEAWCLPEGSGHAMGTDEGAHNLGAALQFVEAQRASPWLVVDLNVTASELAHLVEYLAGSPLSAFGKLRSRDGAIGRWTDEFNLIYIELTDCGQVLPNDASRANYVHWMMDQIRAAPDFAAIRNQVFFIDAMHYEDGRSHTSADYHAGDLRLSQPLDSRQALEETLNDWINSIPRRGTSGGVIVPELIRSVIFDLQPEQLRLVDAVGALLADLGDNTALALLDADYSDRDYLQKRSVAGSALQAVRGLSGLQLLEEPVLIRSGQGPAGQEAAAGDQEEDDQQVLFYAYGSREATLVFALNLDRVSHLVSLQGLNRQASTYELYDHRGNRISQGDWGRKRDNFTLLPGGVLVVRQGS